MYKNEADIACLKLFIKEALQNMILKKVGCNAFVGKTKFSPLCERFRGYSTKKYFQ